MTKRRCLRKGSQARLCCWKLYKSIWMHRNITSQSGIIDHNLFLYFQNKRMERFEILICFPCLFAVPFVIVFRGSRDGKKPAEQSAAGWSAEVRQAQLFCRHLCLCFLSFVQVHSELRAFWDTAGKDASIYSRKAFSLACFELLLLYSFAPPIQYLYRIPLTSKLAKCINSTLPCLENHVLDLHILK